MCNTIASWRCVRYVFIRKKKNTLAIALNQHTKNFIVRIFREKAHKHNGATEHYEMR